MKTIYPYVNNFRFLLEVLKSSNQRKHSLRWIKSLQEDYLLKEKQPWLVFDAIDFLDSLDLRGKNIFEYGSGGSTLFWLSKGASVVSVEHNPFWYDKIYHIIQKDVNLENFDYRLVQPEVLPASLSFFDDPSDPDQYITSELKKERYFRRYVIQIDEFKNNFFDIILIDGRARPSCIKHAITKVKVGGLIILDNAERLYYLAKSTPYLHNFKFKIFNGVVPGSIHYCTTIIYK